jgi:hypothetical protein
MRLTLSLALSLAAAIAAAALGAGAPAHAAQRATCTTHVYPGLQPKHVDSLSLKPKYNSFPPTSGTHYYLPAKWDIYSQPIPQIALVHNLEHGGIVVQYGRDVPKATVAKLRAWYLKDSSGLVVAPLPKLGSGFALGAWNAPPYGKAKPIDAGHGYLALCRGFDGAAFTAFVKAHRYKAGERFPPALMKRDS